MLHTIVDRLHVSASSVDVIRSCRKAMKRKSLTRVFRKERHKFYRAALKRHASNRKLYNHAMRGL